MEDYQFKADKTVGFMLHDMKISGVREEKIESIKSKLYSRLDTQFRDADECYDFNESRDSVEDGFADDLEAMGFNDAQVRSFSALLSGAIKKRFGDCDGNE